MYILLETRFYFTLYGFIPFNQRKTVIGKAEAKYIWEDNIKVNLYLKEMMCVAAW
jgi:hypothetical protein